MKKTKIIFTADIHLGKTAYQSWEIEAEKIRNEKADIFVIGGDMSPSTKNFIDTFNIFDDVAKHHYYVIGNHDIWIVDGGKDGDSFIKYESLIKKQLNGFTCCFFDHVPFEKMMKKGSDQWNMGYAFSGSKKIENVIRQYDKIKYVFCGHTHTKFHGNLYNKECFNVGVDYHEPRYIVVEI